MPHRSAVLSRGLADNNIVANEVLNAECTCARVCVCGRSRGYYANTAVMFGEYNIMVYDGGCGLGGRGQRTWGFLPTSAEVLSSGLRKIGYALQ